MVLYLLFSADWSWCRRGPKKEPREEEVKTEGSAPHQAALHQGKRNRHHVTQTLEIPIPSMAFAFWNLNFSLYIYCELQGKAGNDTTLFSSSKVAVHSFVEKLFRSIWGTPHSRAPPAIKYFFDFLDTQADTLKITDPDVLHIWKTNRYCWIIQSTVDSLRIFRTEVCP